MALSQDEQGALNRAFGKLGVELSIGISAVRAVAEMHEGRAPAGQSAQSVGDDAHLFSKGDTVRIKSGAFSAMTAKVAEVDEEGSTIKATVRVFRRAQVLTLGFGDVEKVRFERT